MRNRYIVWVSSLAVTITATIAVVCLFRYANREHYVIRVVNSTSRQLEHVQVLGLEKTGDLGVLLPGASKSLDLEGKTPMKAISLSFANIDGRLRSTGTILDPKSEIAGRQIEVQINRDQSVSVDPRDLTLREKFRW
jgi:hypothetical protein